MHTILKQSLLLAMFCFSVLSGGEIRIRSVEVKSELCTLVRYNGLIKSYLKPVEGPVGFRLATIEEKLPHAVKFSYSPEKHANFTVGTFIDRNKIVPILTKGTAKHFFSQDFVNFLYANYITRESKFSVLNLGARFSVKIEERPLYKNEQVRTKEEINLDFDIVSDGKGFFLEMEPIYCYEESTGADERYYALPESLKEDEIIELDLEIDDAYKSIKITNLAEVTDSGLLSVFAEQTSNRRELIAELSSQRPFVKTYQEELEKFVNPFCTENLKNNITETDFSADNNAGVKASDASGATLADLLDEIEISEQKNKIPTSRTFPKKEK